MKTTLALLAALTLSLSLSHTVAATEPDRCHTLADIPAGNASWENDWHLRFEGVEMGAPTMEFVRSLEKKGYKVEEKISGGRYVILRGTYKGHRDAEVVVSSKSGKAYTVEVYPKAFTQWKDARLAYEGLRDELKVFTCYDMEGAVPEIDENLNIMHIEAEAKRETSSKWVLEQFRTNNAAYQTTFNVPEGRVSVKINEDVVGMTGLKNQKANFQVTITYRDKGTHENAIASVMPGSRR